MGSEMCIRDRNKRWKSIHEKIDTYKTSTVKKTRFKYWDAVTKDFTISDANVVVLQYIISHFYNTGQSNKLMHSSKNLWILL